jgi:hypothetical protein
MCYLNVTVLLTNQEHNYFINTAYFIMHYSEFETEITEKIFICLFVSGTTLLLVVNLWMTVDNNYCLWFPQLGGLTVYNQHFVVMETEDQILQSYSSDGLLGMGLKENFGGLLTTTSYPHVPVYIIYQPVSVFQNMLQQRIVSSAIFSFYFTK